MNQAGLGLRIGSLFSGIGGLESGLEWAGVGQVTYQVEIDAFCREQLARHWPDVPRWDDITSLDPRKLPPVDVIVGGAPCQDISVAGVAGPRAGLQGPRSGLWSHMARVIEAQGPEWVVVENVAHGQDKWLPAIRRELERQGYATLPVPLEARHVGAPHHRPRIFVLAHANGFEVRELEQRLSGGREDAVREEGQVVPVVDGQGRARWAGEAQPCLSVVDDGLSPGLGSTYWRAVGNAVVPQCAEVIGWMIRELVDAGARARRYDTEIKP